MQSTRWFETGKEATSYKIKDTKILGPSYLYIDVDLATHKIRKEG